jgi:hypothetical protein
VFTENGGAVDKVLIGGELVVAGGRAIGIDRAALAAKAQAAVERLAALNADARHFAERPSASSPSSRTFAAASPTMTRCTGCVATSAIPINSADHALDAASQNQVWW